MKTPPRMQLKTLVSLLAAFVFSALVFASRTALAAGNLSVKTPEVQESNGEWHVKVRIDLPRAPGMMHTPMRFTFTKEAVDERAIMTKGADPVHHRNVLDTPPKYKSCRWTSTSRTRAAGSSSRRDFEFDLARKDGYFEAGEYLMALSGPDGDVGVAAKALTLKGDQPARIPHRAMDFSTTTTRTTRRRAPRSRLS